MIKRDEILAKVSQDVADALGIPESDRTRLIAEVALRTIHLKVVSPLLDSFDFEARPVFREMVINQCRDLIAEPDAPIVEPSKDGIAVED